MLEVHIRNKWVAVKRLARWGERILFASWSKGVDGEKFLADMHISVLEKADEGLPSSYFEELAYIHSCH